jgi:quinol-cytochrome oxidoreductase complex cytochrome b subunit
MVLPALLRDPAGLHGRRLGRDRSSSFLTGGIVDAKFFGVLAMFGSIVVMALAPWLDTSLGPVRPLPPDVQVVVLALRAELHRPDVGGRDAGGRPYPTSR